MDFIHDDFLLSNKAARKLYHKYAESEPIFDYHCHIPPKDIAENRQFNNLFETHPPLDERIKRLQEM